MPLLARTGLPVAQGVPTEELRDNEKFWVLKETGAAFRSYSEYLAAKGECGRPSWVCALTGNSGLTFAEAQRCEDRETAKLEPVRGVTSPIARSAD
jgi:hypothetical protein